MELAGLVILLAALVPPTASQLVYRYPQHFRYLPATQYRYQPQPFVRPVPLSQCHRCRCCAPSVPGYPAAPQPGPYPAPNGPSPQGPLRRVVPGNNGQRKTTPQYVNPCASGPPILGGTGLPAFCSWRSDSSCPSSHFCHVGRSVQTTCCCQRGGDPCALTLSAGQGTASLARFHFDPVTRSCKPFVYRGLKGNANNFLTKEACAKACPVASPANPCPRGQPAVDGKGQRAFCSQHREEACPKGHWCHYGKDAATTACCPPTGFRCKVPLSLGQGQANLRRWHYDQAAQECQPFVYNGQKGNENNYMTKLDCENSGCPIWLNPCTQPISRAAALPCANASAECPKGTFCHKGSSPEASVCCPGGGDVCRQLKAEGQGGAALPRFYYDFTNGQCLPFLYKGMKGNENNFPTKDACEKSGCRIWTNPCEAPLERDAAVACEPANRTCAPGFFCHIGASAETSLCCPHSKDGGRSRPLDVCSLPIRVGQGELQLPRWAFDPAAERCARFAYRGLKGNANNFLSEAECQAAGCRRWENPCALPLNETVAVSCAADRTACPQGTWCHWGATEAARVCCPGAVSPTTVQGGPVCKLPLAVGEGEDSLKRWYSDPDAGLCGECKEFGYSGRGGNQNSYASKAECEEACPPCPNPCQAEPLKGSDGKAQQCNPASPCPNTHWCHIGATQDTTVCCPSNSSAWGSAAVVESPCVLPLAPGEGRENITRFYFSTTSQECRAFRYRGAKGNQNSFLSYSDCATFCPVWTNPCSTGEPLVERKDGEPRACSPSEPCPVETHWCHVGGSTSTTVCCPISGDPCLQPTLPGEGRGALRRWTFDKERQSCRTYIYRGLKGSSNSFLSEEDCRTTCYVPPNPCPSGSPLADPSDKPVECGPRSPCQDSFWCHMGPSKESTVCCPSAAEDPCAQPLVLGRPSPSAKPLQRWYFHLPTGRCKQFAYLGLGGNQNNFLSQGDCRQICPEVNPCAAGDQPERDSEGSVVRCGAVGGAECSGTHFCHVGAHPLSTVCCPSRGNACEEPLTLGTGEAALPRFYYDAAEDECRAFRYRGLGGNQNNFLTAAECGRACPGFRGYCPHGKPALVGVGERKALTCSVETACAPGFVCHINTAPSVGASVCCPSPDSFCFQPRESGPCNGTERVYGYEPTTNTCVPFTYTGCGGNLNRFRSLQTCTEICCNQFRR